MPAFPETSKEFWKTVIFPKNEKVKKKSKLKPIKKSYPKWATNIEQLLIDDFVHRYMGDVKRNGNIVYYDAIFEFTKEQYWHSYPQWAKGRKDFPDFEQGGTGTMIIIMWYHHIHKPGSKECRKKVIADALLKYLWSEKIWAFRLINDRGAIREIKINNTFKDILDIIRIFKDDYKIEIWSGITKKDYSVKEIERLMAKDEKQ